MRAIALNWHVVPVSEKTNWVLFSVTLEDGSSGWGEATAFGQEVAISSILTALTRQIEQVRPLVHGQAMALLAGRHDSNALRFVRSGLEQALHDAVAQKTGLSLATMLGGPHRESVPVYANINRGIVDRSAAGFAAQAKAVLAEQEYRAIKIAPFDGVRVSSNDRQGQRALFEVGLERVAAVRAAIGAEVDILIDCHARFDVADAYMLIRELAEFKPFWIEEPVDEDVGDVDAMKALRTLANTSGIRLAGAENLSTLSEANRIFDAGFYDAVLPDLRYTGLLNGLSILRLAACRGVGVSIHNPVGPVLDAVSRQVAAALPEFMILERQVAESPLFNALGGGATIKDGSVLVDDAPGHGCRPAADQLNAAGEWAGEAVLSFSGMTGAGPDA